MQISKLLLLIIPLLIVLGVVNYNSNRSFDDIMHSVVFLKVTMHDEKGTENIKSGSGFFIDDNYIVTNSHVIKDGATIDVFSNYSNRSYPAQIKAVSEKYDIALIELKDIRQFQNDVSYTPLEFTNSNNLTYGDNVFALGNPGVLTFSLTKGIVSNPLRIEASNFYIQTDVPVYPGNSGGPLVTEDGEVAGVNTLIVEQFSPEGDAFGALSMSIPSNLVQKIILDLEKYKSVQIGHLGVHISSSENSKYAIVSEIETDSPADKAKLKVDDAIIAINGYSVNTFSNILYSLTLLSPGDEISLTYIRNGETFVVPIKLGYTKETD